MITSLFEEIQKKRGQMTVFAEKALKYEWIDQNTYNSIVEKIANDTLTIGVVGQMKCGKSTFLNAFLFEDDILPAATTPMTAALSVITYGQKKNIEAEFYTSSEWSEILSLANCDLSEAVGNMAQELKIKAAKELVNKSSSLGGKLNTLLGTKRTDDLDNLIDYVGANGHYVAITKSVIIHYPKEWLKGVEIVDTPGFNDPVVSREERTQDFLKKADVVLMLLYAGRAFDATDRSIVFEKIQSVGVGKILIGVNKYDLCYEQGETVEEIKENVLSEIRKACREYRDPLINELLTDLVPIPFSSNMALMAKMPISKIQANGNLSFHWKKTCETFEISTQKQMHAESLITDLENTIQELVEKSKMEILFKKPINVVIQAGMNIKMKVENAMNEKKIMYDSLSMPADELQARLETLTKIQRRVERKITKAIEELKDEYDEEINKIIYKLEDLVDNAKDEINKIIDSEKRKKIERCVEQRWESLFERDLKRATDKTQKRLRMILREKSNDLAQDIEGILRKYIDDADELFDAFKDAIDIGMSNMSDSANENSEDEDSNESDGFSWSDLFMIPAIPIAGIVLFLDDIFNYRSNARNDVQERFAQIDFANYRELCMEARSKYVEFLHVTVINEILKSLIMQLEDVQNNKAEKETEMKKLQIELEELNNKKEKVDLQLSEMQKLKNEMI